MKSYSLAAGFVLGSDLEEIWSRADGGRKREVPKVDMALVSIDDS